MGRKIYKRYINVWMRGCASTQVYVCVCVTRSTDRWTLGDGVN